MKTPNDYGKYIIPLIKREKIIDGESIYSSIADFLGDINDIGFAEGVFKYLTHLFENGVIARYELNYPKDKNIANRIDPYCRRFYYIMVDESNIINK